VQPQTTLETVQDYVTDIRTLLQDVVQPYRYDDPSLLTAFNVALLEGRRVRPDLFVYSHHSKVPSFKTVDNTEVNIEPMFRLAFVFAGASHAIMRDQEDVQDQRATSFNAMFTEMLTGIKPIPIMGATPGAGVRK
jgi:hypothetical protein